MVVVLGNTCPSISETLQDCYSGPTRWTKAFFQNTAEGFSIWPTPYNLPEENPFAFSYNYMCTVWVADLHLAKLPPHSSPLMGQVRVRSWGNRLTLINKFLCTGKGRSLSTHACSLVRISTRSNFKLIIIIISLKLLRTDSYQLMKVHSYFMNELNAPMTS